MGRKQAQPVATPVAAVVKAEAPATKSSASQETPAALAVTALLTEVTAPAPVKVETAVPAPTVPAAKKSDKGGKPGKAAGAEAAEVAADKVKLVRDSFTMPRADFELIAVLKERALGFRRPTKKSELLRAGLQALAALDDARLQAALEGLTPIKAGRPKKG